MDASRSEASPSTEPLPEVAEGRSLKKKKSKSGDKNKLRSEVSQLKLQLDAARSELARSQTSMAPQEEGGPPLIVFNTAATDQTLTAVTTNVTTSGAAFSRSNSRRGVKSAEKDLLSVVAELRDMALALGEEEAAQQASSSSSSSSIASASSASTAAAGAPHAPALAEGKTRKSSKTLLVRAPPTVASLNVLADKVAKIAAQLAEPGAGRKRRNTLDRRPLVTNAADPSTLDTLEVAPSLKSAVSADSINEAVLPRQFASHADAVEWAARVIQREYRYYRVRKHFRNLISSVKANASKRPSVDARGGLARRSMSSSTYVRSVASIESLSDRDSRFRAAIYEFNVKPTKGIETLLQNGFIEDDEEDIARFLLMTKELNRAKVGEYLGSADDDVTPIREAFVRLISFSGLSFDLALRKFLVDSNFRVSGEAQVISRMMESFGQCFFEEDEQKTFANPDAAYVLAYSVLMLNTDAHNPNVRNRMTVAEFVRNNRGINNNADLPNEFLTKLYTSIVNNEIRMKEDTPLTRALDAFEPALDSLAQPYRSLRYELTADEVQDILVATSARLPRSLYICNDCLLIARSARKHKEYRHVIPFAKVKVTDVRDTSFYQNVVDLSYGGHKPTYLSFANALDKSTFLSFVKDNCQDMSHVAKGITDKTLEAIAALNRAALAANEQAVLGEQRQLERGNGTLRRFFGGGNRARPSIPRESHLAIDESILRTSLDGAEENVPTSATTPNIGEDSQGQPRQLAAVRLNRTATLPTRQKGTL